MTGVGRVKTKGQRVDCAGHTCGGVCGDMLSAVRSVGCESSTSSASGSVRALGIALREAASVRSAERSGGARSEYVSICLTGTPALH